MKIPKVFPKIPGSKILGNPVPKNPGIPGFGKIPSRKIPGLKFLIPLGPDPDPNDHEDDDDDDDDDALVL